MSRRLRDFISENDFAKVFHGTKSIQHKLAFSLAYYSCVSIADIMSLTPENFKQQKLFILGKRTRELKVSDFVNRNIHNFPIKICRRALQQAINKISIKTIGRKIHFDLLRQSGANLYLSLGYSKEKISYMMGHTHKENFRNRSRFRARLVMEKFLGRKLDGKEQVHHLDDNPHNNDLSNLYLFNNNASHMHFHGLMNDFIRNKGIVLTTSKGRKRAYDKYRYELKRSAYI